MFLNARAKNHKMLRRKCRGNLCDLGFGNRFLDVKTKTEATKFKKEKKDFNTIKSFCASKGHYEDSEKTTYRMGENICKSYI